MREDSSGKSTYLYTVDVEYGEYFEWLVEDISSNPLFTEIWRRNKYGLVRGFDIVLLDDYLLAIF